MVPRGMSAAASKRPAYELSLFAELRDRLRAGDIWVWIRFSDSFTHPRTELP